MRAGGGAPPIPSSCSTWHGGRPHDRGRLGPLKGPLFDTQGAPMAFPPHEAVWSLTNAGFHGTTVIDTPGVLGATAS